VSAPTRASIAGRAYLDLRKLARKNKRPVDELLQLYVLEAFLVRLAGSRFAGQLVLKGGVLLAAFGERRATRDIDLQGQAIENDVESIRATACEIATIALEDGVIFDVEMARAEEIRDEEIYAGVRVTMQARLASARHHFHVDMNVGDPISPVPKDMRLPRLLGGEIVLLGYPLAMVHAEKIVTAIARGTVNTRWRDFADVYMLSRRHVIDGTELARSTCRVAEHRQVQLLSLVEVLCGPWGDRSAEMGGVAPQAEARGPFAGAVWRCRLGGHRLRRSSDRRLRQRSLVGPSHWRLVMM